MTAVSAILTLAESKGLQKSFNTEMLERFDETLLNDGSIRKQIEEVFRLDRSFVTLFIQLASTSRRKYYTREEMSALLKLFLELTELLGHLPLPGQVEEVPHYDRGGKEWLEQNIKAFKGFDAPSQSLSAFQTFKEKLKTAQLVCPLVHRHLFRIDLAREDLTNKGVSLSLQRVAIKTMSLVSNRDSLYEKSLKAYLELVEMLKKENDIFSESDQIRILQVIHIFAARSAPLSEGGELTIVYWYKAVKETMGEALFTLVSNPQCFDSDKRLDLQAIIRLLQWVVEIGEDADVRPHLMAFHDRKISFAELLDRLETVKREIEEKKYPEKSLEEVLKAFAMKEGQVSHPLSQEELAKIAHQFAGVESLCKELRKCDVSELASKLRAIRSKGNVNEKDKLTLIAIAREAIRLKFKVYPYNTQVLAVLGILNDPQGLKGRIAQMRTGEGKSTVTTMLAFYNACLGNTVDVISPSRYLAERDQLKYFEFFRLFGISTSHICTDDPKPENFKGQIIYGTNSDFEFAVLWDSIREKRERTLQVDGGEVIERPFHVAIVDEVDNLFIDTALNSARISIPSKRKYGWVYQPIFSFVKDNLELLRKGLDLTSSLREKLNQLQEEKLKSVVDALEDEKLGTWIQAAKTSLLYYHVDHDYVVMPVEISSPAGKTTEQQIVLMDKQNTGRKMVGMHAPRGVHEFLEAKHHLAIHTESAMPASLSHPVYFAKYHRIYGLTGTLGSQIERDEIERIYRVDTFDVPPHKTNQRKLLPPIICHSEEEYQSTILQEIQEMVQQNRPTLLLLESIQESEDFANFLKPKGLQCQLLNERQAEHENFIISRAGFPKMVTVATNTAGRGTDIILHPKSLKQGGLHVIFGFYPTNDRVEDQGFGRSGRQGQPGTGRMILLSGEKKTIEEFITQREILTRELSKSRMKKIGIEQMNHGYLHEFLMGIRKWHDVLNADFLKKVLGDLDKMIQNKTKCTPGLDLEGSELKLSQEFLHYLEQPHSGEHFLEQFIQTAKNALLEKILLFWAENFYGRLDDLYLNIEPIAIYRLKLKGLHISTKSHWEKYLQDPAAGFWNYLRTIVRFPVS